MGVVIVAALAVVVVLGLVAHRLWRSRTDQRLQWQATRDRDWTTAELEALSIPDAAA